YHGFCPQQREVVWNLLLQDGSEGPPLIDYSVTQKRRLSPPLLLMAHSEMNLQRKLDLAPGLPHRTRHLAEAGSAKEDPRRVEGGSVQSVKKFRPELQASYLAFSQRPLLVNGRVPVPQSLRVHRMSACTTASAERRELITTGVEPRRGSLVESLRWIAYQVRKLRIAGRAERCDTYVLVIRGEVRIKWHTAINCNNARELPMSDRRIEPLVSGMSGDVIVVTGAQAMPDIETSRSLE